MELLTIRQFAEQEMVSYEAVRRQLERYKDDLQGHIIRKGNTRFLDETAVNFLSEKRKDNPIIESKRNYQGEIEQLQEQVENLKIKLLEAQQKIINLHELETENAKNKLLLELKNEQIEQDRQRMQERNDSLIGELTEVKVQLQAAQAEADSFERSWFGFWRKKK